MTSSVAIAGVLLVFCYLIVPSVGAVLFADRIGRRLAIGWAMGTIVSALGVYVSVVLDLPTGAGIVCAFGGVLLLMFLLHFVLYERGKTGEVRLSHRGAAAKAHSVKRERGVHGQGQ